MSVTIEAADAAELPFVRQLLSQNNLPTQEAANHPEWFVVAYANEEPVGTGGLQPCDHVGLLRSLAVESSYRGEGIGTALCQAIEKRATDAEFTKLYLLTTDAEGFFENQGYTRSERDAAPASIQQTAEFSEVCPESASCMVKTL